MLAIKLVFHHYFLISDRPSFQDGIPSVLFKIRSQLSFALRPGCLTPPLLALLVLF